MAFYDVDTIREKLATMEKGSAVFLDKNIVVTFNLQGEFNVFKGVNHYKHSTTKSLKEAVAHVHIALN